MTRTIPHRPLLTIKEVARICDVSDKTVRRWLATRYAGEELEARVRADADRRERAEQFADLVLRYRDRLRAIYEGAASAPEQRIEKAQTFGALRVEYAALRDSAWEGYAGYDAWFDRDLNNAHLAAVGEYRDLVPALQGRLDAAHGDLDGFFTGLLPLAKLDRAERRSRLMEGRD